jgi:hypothetical protein
MTEVAAFMTIIGFFASVADRRHRERLGRVAEAGEEVDLVLAR